MKYHLLFIVEEEFLGESERAAMLRHAVFMVPPSYIYLCAFCGRIFARVVCTDGEGRVSRWSAMHCLCTKCEETQQQSMFEWPGSLWLEWDREYNLAFPKTVLERELEIHLKSYERYQHV